MKTRSALIYTRILLIRVIIMLSFSACSRKKYTVNFDGGFFESKRTQYYAGEKVTVRYDIIATDTDYHFYIDDDVEMTQDFDGGYVFTFIMPKHDVTLHEESYNSMVYVPGPDEMPSD